MNHSKLLKDLSQKIKNLPIKLQSIIVLIIFVTFIKSGFSQTRTISGTIYNDTNALTVNGTVDGIGFNTPSTRQLYVNLVRVSTGNVVRLATVSSNGTYSMTGTTPTATYTIQLTTIQGTVGSPPPATTIPSSWVYTGEFVGTGSGNDGTADGLITQSVSGSVTNVNFGIEQLPFAINVAHPFSVSKYGVDISLNSLNAIDSSNGHIQNYKITVLPNKGILNYRGIAVSVNQIISFAGADSLTYLSDTSYTGTVTFQYKPIDNADLESSSSGTYTFTVRTPFICNGDLLFSRQTSPTSILNKITFVGADYDVSSAINTYSYLQNASGWYQGFPYIMRHTPNSNTVYQLHPDNTLDSVVISGLPTSSWNNAIIDSNGILYILQNGTFNLYRINLTTLALSGPTTFTGISIPTIGNVIWGDIVIDPITDSMYCWYHPTAATTSPVGLYKMNLASSVFSSVGTDSAYTMGTLFFNDQGRLFGYGATSLGGTQNRLFTISTVTGNPAVVGTLDISTSQSDGCNCPNRPSITMSVTPAVTKSFCGTATFNYTFGLRNLTGGTISGLTVRDTLNTKLSWSFNISTLQTTLRSTFGSSVVVTVTGNGGGTNNVIAISGLSIPVGYNTFTAQVTTNGTFSNGESVSEQSYLTGIPSAYGALDYSDDPGTIPFKDACVVTFTVTTTCGNLSGNVFDDQNGVIDAIINGTGINIPDGIPLYANLVNGSNLVVTVATIASGGLYSFTDVSNGTYTIQLSTNQGIVNNTAPAISIPTGWVNTAEGTSGSGDGTVNGRQSVTVASANVNNLNFGIEKAPEAFAKTYINQDSATFNIASGNTTYLFKAILSNSSGTADGTVNGTDASTKPGKLSGSDYEDGIYSGLTGTNKRRTLVITVLPNAVNDMLAYNNGSINVLLIANPTVNDSSYVYWNSSLSRYEIPYFNDTSLFVFIKKNGHLSTGFTYAWKDSAGVTGTTANYNIASPTPLPVTLISFDAKLSGNQVNLEWRTASEHNTNYFSVERSEDIHNFQCVLNLPAAGTSSGIKKYAVVDKTIDIRQSDILYYRLVTYDFDNTFSVSNIKSVNCGLNRENAIKAWPVPFTSHLSINIYANQMENIMLLVTDVNGKESYCEELMIKKGDNLLIRSQFGFLPAGIYTLSVIRPGEVNHLQLIKSD